MSVVEPLDYEGKKLVSSLGSRVNPVEAKKMLSSLKDGRVYHNRNIKNKNSMFHAHVLIVYVPQS